jgi:hypothetical protein
MLSKRGIFEDLFYFWREEHRLFELLMMVDKKYYGFYAASTTPINHKNTMLSTEL